MQGGHENQKSVGKKHNKYEISIYKNQKLCVNKILQIYLIYCTKNKISFSWGKKSIFLFFITYFFFFLLFIFTFLFLLVNLFINIIYLFINFLFIILFFIFLYIRYIFYFILCISSSGRTHLS